MVYIQKKEEILNTLVDQINNFDMYFEMSDDDKIYTKGFNEKYNIKTKVEKLSFMEKLNLYKKLNKHGKMCWNRYFK